MNVPIGRYTTQVFCFAMASCSAKSQSSLQVHKVGLERVVYMLAYRYPLTYGLLAVLIAMSAGLLAWTAFRREQWSVGEQQARLYRIDAGSSRQPRLHRLPME